MNKHMLSEARASILKLDRHILDAPKGGWRKTLLIFAAVLVLVGVLGYLTRGWMRHSVIPRAAAVIEGKNLKKQTEDLQSKLQNPFKGLGYTSVEVTPTHCTLDHASFLKTSVSCDYKMHAYGAISQDAATKDSVSKAAQKTEDLLKQGGWQGEYSDDGQFVSLNSLVTNINRGIDYTPDASYFKQIDNGMYCMFSSTTAFNAPKPAAMSTVLNCNRTYYFLGVPY